MQDLLLPAETNYKTAEQLWLRQICDGVCGSAMIEFTQLDMVDMKMRMAYELMTGQLVTYQHVSDEFVIQMRHA